MASGARPFGAKFWITTPTARDDKRAQSTGVSDRSQKLQLTMSWQAERGHPGQCSGSPRLRLVMTKEHRVQESVTGIRNCNLPCHGERNVAIRGNVLDCFTTFAMTFNYSLLIKHSDVSLHIGNLQVSLVCRHAVPFSRLFYTLHPSPCLLNIENKHSLTTSP